MMPISIPSASLPRSLSEMQRLTQDIVDPALRAALDRIEARTDHTGARGAPLRLVEAMGYSLLSPGKRLRPILCFGAAQAVGGSPWDALPGAIALEMTHAYSLIHDDLPSMDDDDFRRGQPSCHRKFDEATALLAGDALLTEVFLVLTDPNPFHPSSRVVTPEQQLRAVRVLGEAIGTSGMVGGQHDDLAQPPMPLTESWVQAIHRRKTGCLIEASVSLGAIFGGASPDSAEKLRDYGAAVGMAFQLVDDILDNDGLCEIKSLEEVKEMALACTHKAKECLSSFGASAKPLADLADQMANRTA
jgi:geranylgeranyl diphosphate synthase, type II